MEDIDKVQNYIASLDGSVDELEDIIQPLLGKDLRLITQNSDPITRIRTYNNYLYVTISTLFAYLKSTGVKTESHPIMEELTRIKKSMARVDELEKKLKLKDTSESDKETAKRLIQQTLGGKINGGGAAAPDGITSPAISSETFKSLTYQGKHTKFDQPKASKVQKPKTSKKADAGSSKTRKRKA